MNKRRFLQRVDGPLAIAAIFLLAFGLFMYFRLSGPTAVKIPPPNPIPVAKTSFIGDWKGRVVFKIRLANKSHLLAMPIFMTFHRDGKVVTKVGRRMVIDTIASYKVQGNRLQISRIRHRGRAIPVILHQRYIISRNSLMLINSDGSRLVLKRDLNHPSRKRLKLIKQSVREQST